jgi:hypothetical protein
VKEVSAPEGDGGCNPGQSNKGMHLSMSNFVSNARDDCYEPGQSSQVGGNVDGCYSGEADADEVDRHMQNQMEDEDTDGDSGHADDSGELDEEENAEEVPNPASWNQDFSSAMTVNDGHDSA